MWRGTLGCFRGSYVCVSMHVHIMLEHVKQVHRGMTVFAFGTILPIEGLLYSLEARFILYILTSFVLYNQLRMSVWLMLKLEYWANLLI